MNSFIKEQKGITLIALVITIIVLLILAGIAISMLSGENGILKQAVDAKVETEREEKLEKIKLAITASMTNEKHKVDKEVLEKELKDNLDIVTINGEDSLIIEVDGEFYKINEDGTINQNNYNEQHESTTTGSIQLQNDGIKEIVDYKLYGNSIQNEGKIKSVGDLVTNEEDKNYNKYKIPIKVNGKNMFNLDYFVEFYNQYKDYEKYKSTYVEEFESEKDLYKIYGTLNVAGREVKYMEGEFKENTQYTFSIKMYDVLGLTADGDKMPGMGIKYYYTDGTTNTATPGDRINTAGNWIIINSTSKLGKTVSHLQVSFSTGSGYSYVKYAQLEEGTNVTEHEKYEEPKIYNIYLDEPLRSIGEVRDYIDFKNKKIVRYIAEESGELKELAKPIEEKIDLSKILTKEGTNIITVDTEIKPSNFEITYIRQEK